MATGMETAPETVREAKTTRPSRPGGEARKRRSGSRPSDGGARIRYFLGESADGEPPVLSREVESANAALVESLRTGKSFFALTEYTAVAELAATPLRVRMEPVARGPHRFTEQR